MRWLLLGALIGLIALLLYLHALVFGVLVAVVAVVVGLASVGYLVLLSLIGEKLNLDWEIERELAIYGTSWIIFGVTTAALRPEHLVPVACILAFAGIALFSCGRLSAAYLAFGVGIALGTLRGDLAWLAPLSLAVGGAVELVQRLRNRRGGGKCEP